MEVNNVRPSRMVIPSLRCPSERDLSSRLIFPTPLLGDGQPPKPSSEQISIRNNLLEVKRDVDSTILTICSTESLSRSPLE